MTRNDLITHLGFRLEETDDPAQVARLLEASGLAPLPAQSHGTWHRARYLVAYTGAGGTAACAGWTRGTDCLVLHSVAVAAPSRGTGLGASLFATLLGQAMDEAPVPQVYLTTLQARRFFADFGFTPLEPQNIPFGVRAHPEFARAPQQSTAMVRRYNAPNRGLDQCSFRLVHNSTPNATLPLGSVFFFRQAGEILQASYRGIPVRRGHLIGAINAGALNFLWHHVLEDARLDSGGGRILVNELPDGRRELRERLGNTPGELLLREV